MIENGFGKRSSGNDQLSSSGGKMNSLSSKAKCSSKAAPGTGQLRLRRVLMIGLLCYPAISSAYVGPGAGITMLGALWAVILAVLFVVGGILILPIRALLRRRKGGAEADSSAGKDAEASGSLGRERND